jgi:cellobionic acid phosphorylase
MSWMNQSGEYRADLGGVVASCVTPYQKVADYFKQKDFKDKTYFLCEHAPDAWEVRQSAFEGEGGLQQPSAIQDQQLGGSDARYETPAAAVQYRLSLADGEARDYRFIFGPAFDDAEIRALREKYLSAAAFDTAAKEYAAYVAGGGGCLRIETPDADLDNFVNNWLPRQVFYHGDVNRLSTDPQTRNYLQDNMGMSFIKPGVMRSAFLHALSQQEASGAMPDGILLTEGAELKYINQVPHTDHCVWLPVALKVYLDETGDYDILNEDVIGKDSGVAITVSERVSSAMDWLLQARDKRGLSYIAQGDWCDPMNMVGYKGRGVSGWLTVATAYALNLWAEICETAGASSSLAESARHFRAGARNVNRAANEHLWDGDWFARGITDDNVTFGISKDKEGRIWLNPQAWAILGGAANAGQRASLVAQVEDHLVTPYGVQMFAPPYSAMRDDVGRVTQKHPGSAENGAVYNHAAVFYIYSLYTAGESDRAYDLLRRMLPGPSEADYLQRGQLPVFIPNYYRGAWREYPRTAGRSSQLFNTGTVSWAYLCFVEGLCGLKGTAQGLSIKPQLPSHWDGINVERKFRHATFKVSIQRADVDAVQVWDGEKRLTENVFTGIVAGGAYALKVLIPR